MTLHTGPVVATRDTLTVIDCQQCGFCHLDPLPDPEQVERFYTSDDAFYAEGGTAWFEKERWEHEAGLWQAAYRWQAGLLGEGSLIDWGCGSGWFIRHWHTFDPYHFAVGIEPSEQARIEALKNSPYYRKYRTVTPYPWKGEPPVKGIASMNRKLAGHVRLSLVLEHVVDPLALLIEAKRYLARRYYKGKLMVIVPNEFNPLQRRLVQRHGYWFVAPYHINYFSPSGLRNLLQSSGYKVIGEYATCPIELFALSGRFPYIGNGEIGRKIHTFRLRLEKAVGPRIFDLYSLLYRRFGWGRELVFVAEKNGN